MASELKHTSFKNGSIDVAADLHLPDGFDEKKTYAALVIVTFGSSVKGQIGAVYGGKMAERGFVTLAFDPSYQGESGGEPRDLEDPIRPTSSGSQSRQSGRLARDSAAAAPSAEFSLLTSIRFARDAITVPIHFGSVARFAAIEWRCSSRPGILASGEIIAGLRRMLAAEIAR